MTQLNRIILFVFTLIVLFASCSKKDDAKTITAADSGALQELAADSPSGSYAAEDSARLPENSVSPQQNASQVQEDIRAVVLAYFDALGQGDLDKAKNLLTEESKLSMEALFSLTAAMGGPSVEEITEALRIGIPETEILIGKAEINGDQATLVVEGDGNTAYVPLLKTDGEWKIELVMGGFGLSGPDGEVDLDELKVLFQMQDLQDIYDAESLQEILGSVEAEYQPNQDDLEELEQELKDYLEELENLDFSDF